MTTTIHNPLTDGNPCTLTEEAVERYCNDLDIEQVRQACAEYGVTFDPPVLDDLYPQWESEVRHDLFLSILEARDAAA